jgi:hypothetical protein
MNLGNVPRKEEELGEKTGEKADIFFTTKIFTAKKKNIIVKGFTNKI